MCDWGVSDWYFTSGGRDAVRASDGRCCGTAAAAAGRRAGRQTHPARACAPTPHIHPYVLQLSFKTSNKTNITCAFYSFTIRTYLNATWFGKLLNYMQGCTCIIHCTAATMALFSLNKLQSAGVILAAPIQYIYSISYMMHKLSWSYLIAYSAKETWLSRTSWLSVTSVR